MENKPIYLDCNATTPMEPSVCDKIRHYMEEEYGNPASRTHLWGTATKKAVALAREQIAEVVNAKIDEVIFTSGATESNNLAVLGLLSQAEKSGKKHIITTPIEHKSVLEPLSFLESRGIKVDYLPVNQQGVADVEALRELLREETLAVSIMHINNETGVIQPLDEVISILKNSSAYLHVDAAQGFGKEIEILKNKRIDMMSASGHKIFGPKGVGVLIVRKRGFHKIPLKPLMFGGGHERGLRPGTLPVPLIVGFGEAAEIAHENHEKRRIKCLEQRELAIKAFKKIGGIINGNPDLIAPHVLNISFPGLDSEAAIVALRDKYAISNGSACTSHKYSPSHVLESMQLSKERINSALRMSWCHMTPPVDWEGIAKELKNLF